MNFKAKCYYKTSLKNRKSLSANLNIYKSI